MVSEGISAMLALALLDDSQSLPRCGAAWTALTHPDRHALLHERTLTAAPDDGNHSHRTCQRTTASPL